MDLLFAAVPLTREPNRRPRGHRGTPRTVPRKHRITRSGPAAHHRPERGNRHRPPRPPLRPQLLRRPRQTTIRWSWRSRPLS